METSFFFHCLTLFTVELFFIHPTKQKFPCWNLCLLPLIPSLCTSERTHLCWSPPKPLLGCCEVCCNPSLFQAGQTQLSQPHVPGRGSSPNHLCSPLLSSHHFLDLTSLLEDVKLDTMASLAPWRKLWPFTCWVYWFDLVFTEGALHPSVQVAEEDV